MKKSLCERLRELRGSDSQTAFCQKIQQKQGTYSAWERGQKDPSSSAIALICKSTGVSADWLLGLSPQSISAATSPLGQPNAPLTPAETYWRTLALSQQDTIASLTRLLNASSKPTPAHCGGRGATKNA